MQSGPHRNIWLFAAAVFVSTLPLIAHSQNRPDSVKPATRLTSPNLSLDEIITRMEDARDRNKQTSPFLVIREYQMFHGNETTPASQVKAQINVVSPHDREYRILESKGNDRGEKVVRKILDHESQAEKSNPSPTAVVRDNYEFSDQGRQTFEGVNCYVLGLKPKREEPSLIEGRAWVDPTTFGIRKIEGKMAKSPSWWVKDVNLVVNFGEMEGIWIQTATHAVAEVRVIGKYTVFGRALDVQTAGSVASNVPAQKKAYDRHRNGLPAAFLYETTTISRR